jgi:hypothetical protein
VGNIHLLICFSSFLFIRNYIFILIILLSAFVFLPVWLLIYNEWKDNRDKLEKVKKLKEELASSLVQILGASGPSIPAEILDLNSISCMLQKNAPILIEDVRTILGMDHRTFDALIIKKAIELGFWIDGDGLLFDKAEYKPFLDWMEKCNDHRMRIDKIAASMTKFNAIHIVDLKELMGLEDSLLDNTIIDWSTQFGFKIDGDELIVDPQKTAGFIAELQVYVY